MVRKTAPSLSKLFKFCKFHCWQAIALRFHWCACPSHYLIFWKFPTFRKDGKDSSESDDVLRIYPWANIVATGTQLEIKAALLIGNGNNAWWPSHSTVLQQPHRISNPPIVACLLLLLLLLCAPAHPSQNPPESKRGDVGHGRRPHASSPSSNVSA